MNWASAADFWSMGGYGFYVWGSYAAVIAVITIEIVLLGVRRRRAVSKLARIRQEAGSSKANTLNTQ